MKATYIDHMGTDLTVVNAARVSFGKTSEVQPCAGCVCLDEARCPSARLSKADQGLIAFLARGCTTGEWEALLGPESGFWDHPDRDQLDDIVQHIKRMPTHWTPFGHCQVSIHLKVPMFVAAQIKKHQTGFVVNEISRRYVDAEPEFYMPETWRKRAESVKQGSSEESVDEAILVRQCETSLNGYTLQEYKFLLEQGVCPEQARMVLPQSTYTEFWMTGSLYGWSRLYVQRTDPHAQRETQEVARQIGEIIEPLFPVSWKELTR